MIDGDKMKITLINKDDERLKIPCDEVNDFENKEFYIGLINQMQEICFEHRAFAAAAPQFGINKRFILVINATEESKEDEDNHNLLKKYNATTYFNPKITTMKGLQYYYESCMSIKNTIGKVARPYYIELDYQDIDGNYHHKIATDFEAIVLCHEIDHLDGILFNDKAEKIISNINLDQRTAIRNKFPREVIFKDKAFNQDNVTISHRTKIYSK